MLVILGLYLLFGPIEALVRKPLPIKRDYRRSTDDAPTWIKVFFRGLGIALLVLAGLLLAPLIQAS